MTVLSPDFIWRDYVTAGVPGSGAHDPDKSEIRDWANAYTAAIFKTKAYLETVEVSANDVAVRTMGYATADDGGGGLYRRISYADITANGYPAASYLRSADRYLPDGSTDSTNGGYWVIVPEFGFVRLKQFGAKGDYDANDSTALVNALAVAKALNAVLYLDAGVFRILDTSIAIPEHVSIWGSGAAKIATFPQRTGEKALLRPGYKDQLSGSVLIFDGTPDASFTTVRSDSYASAAYCMHYGFHGGIDLRNFSIIQDMDVLDSGGDLTTGSTDNRSSSYEAGLILQSTNSTVENVTIFGYFDVGGLWIHNEDDDTPIDPDYNKFDRCLISSGVHITGHDTAAGVADDGGNTGSVFLGCGIYGWDHHTRADGDFTVPAIYMDGYLAGSIGSIRGHRFVGCNVRCYANDAVVFGRADDIQFSSCVWEFPELTGVTGADADGGFVATANTGDVWVFGGAGTSPPKITDFIAQTGGKWLFAGGGHFDGFMVGEGTSGVRFSGANSDSVIQLTKDFSSSASDWTIRRDDSDGDALEIRYDGTSVFNIDTTGAIGALVLQSKSATINSGEITISGASMYNVDTEGGAATDNLDTINGGVENQILILKAQSVSRTVVVRNGTGNIICGADITLDHSQDRLILQKQSTNWLLIAFEDNAA